MRPRFSVTFGRVWEPAASSSVTAASEVTERLPSGRRHTRTTGSSRTMSVSRGPVPKTSNV